MFTLKDVASYIRFGKAERLLLSILRTVGRIFNFTEERHNRLNRYVSVINAYKSGMPIQDIEKKFGCTKRTIYDYVKRAGITPRSYITPETKKGVIRDYKNKIPVAKIVKLHGVSARYVQKTVKEAGLRRNKTKAYPGSK